MMELKTLSPLISQIVLRNLGIYCSERLNVDQYYLMESINLMISDMGEDFIKEKYKEQGKDWNKIKTKLDIINKQISKTKVFYDFIQDKTFEKKQVSLNKVQVMIRKYFSKYGSKIAITQREIYDLFVFLVKNCTIQRQQIKSEAFKIPEHTGFRKIEMTKRSTATQQPTESE